MNNKTLDWGRITVFAFPMHIILYIIVMVSTDIFVNADLGFFLNYAVITIPIMLVVLTTLYRKYGMNDFRFKSGIYGTIGLLSVSISSAVITEESVIDNGHLNLAKLPAIMVVILPTFLIILASIFAVNNLIEPFDRQVSILSDDILIEQNYSSLITDEYILNDSIFGGIAQFINKLVISTKNLLDEIQGTSELIATSSEELVVSSEQVKDAADDVASSTQQMSQGANEQTDLIQSLTEQLKRADDDFNEISKQIQSKTSLINNIALQTNILALNAGIEASRAGDYGRGFAVVAENVRKLSEETSKASDSIEGVVMEIQAKLAEVFDILIDKTSEVLHVSENTASSAMEISAIIEEMNASMEQINVLADNLNEEAGRSSNIFDKIQLK